MKKLTNNKKPELNLNYYFNEQGLMVFTAKHHLERGYCCKNNCRHCPYEKEIIK